MKQGTIETLVGFLVLIIAFSFFVFAYNVSNVGKVGNVYMITAGFQDVDGISEGSEVKLAGMKIGYVDSLKLDPVTLYATVILHIDKTVPIPDDSSALIATTGLMGGKYIRIIPGGSESDLAEAGQIKITQSSLNIEDLIGKLMYSLTSK